MMIFPISGISGQIPYKLSQVLKQLLSKLAKRSTMRSTKFENHVMLPNYNVIVIFPISSQLKAI